MMRESVLSVCRHAAAGIWGDDLRVSYDLAVWEGARPPDDHAGLEAFEDLMDRAGAASPTPPTARIRSFAEALVRRYPEDEHGPWATVPVLEEASGGSVYLTLTFDAVEEVVDHVARLAEEHGLVCFDPQLECLLPHYDLGELGQAEDSDAASWTEGPVSRKDAATLLRIPRPKLDLFADRVGAQATLELAQLLTIELLAIDDLHPPERWRETARELQRYLAAPDLNEPTMLVVGEKSARIHHPGPVFTSAMATNPPIAMYDVPGALATLLDRLSRAS
jgi:hypothetical protein